LDSESEQAKIEQEFVQSWIKTEEFFSLIVKRWEQFKALYDLTAACRERGYDTKFRAGQSLATFILSRSRRHGLRANQAYLEFYIYEDGRMRATYVEPPASGVQNIVDGAKLTPEVEDLLARLLSHPID
jgi:hypothetical protein